ncbi:phospholipid carrier-dependent glycosyltransferase [Alteromonas gracilis]
MTDTATAPRGRTPDVPRTPVERVMARVRGRDELVAWIGTIGLTLLAFAMRLWNLDRPHAFAFDETYYAKDAWSLINHGYVRNYVDDANEQILEGRTTGLWTGDPSMVVHPEIGKWLIGVGQQVFGMNPFGWRIMAAVVGSLMVLVLIRLARRLTGSTALGLVAGLLLAFDGLHLVLSRLALLDVFQAFFILAAVSALVADRDWGRERLARLVPERITDPAAWGPRLWWRPWRVLAGVWFGLAVSTKWSSLFAVAAFGLLVWAWDSGARRRLGVRLAPLRSAILDAAPAFGWLVLLPAVIYVLSWTGWLLHAGEYERVLSDTQYGPYWGSYLETDASGLGEVWQSLRSLWHYHHDVYTFHTEFLDDATHTYASNPWGWLVLNRPVGVDAQLGIEPGQQGCTAVAGSTCLRQVLLLGNPAVWWAAVPALAYAAVSWLGRRDWRFGLVVVGVLSGWLPWLSNADRPIFSYYAITFLPFLILGVVLALGRILGPRDASPTRRRIGAAVVGAYLVVVLALFAWFWPIWTDGLLTTGEWLQRIWFKTWI